LDWATHDDVKHFDSSASQAEHRLQESDPGPENSPEGHAVHIADPETAEYVPDGQIEQEEPIVA
jgi:hypothetical protein